MFGRDIQNLSSPKATTQFGTLGLILSRQNAIGYGLWVTLVWTSVIDVHQHFDKDERQPISGLLYCRHMTWAQQPMNFESSYLTRRRWQFARDNRQCRGETGLSVGWSASHCQWLPKILEADGDGGSTPAVFKIKFERCNLRGPSRLARFTIRPRLSVTYQCSTGWLHSSRPSANFSHRIKVFSISWRYQRRWQVGLSKIA